jgi:hypothetical protein
MEAKKGVMAEEKMEALVNLPTNPSMQAKLPAHIHLDLQAEASLHAQVKINLMVKWQPGYDLKKKSKRQVRARESSRKIGRQFCPQQLPVHSHQGLQRVATLRAGQPSHFCPVRQCNLQVGVFFKLAPRIPNTWHLSHRGATGYSPHRSLLQTGTAISSDRTGKSPPRPARPQRGGRTGDSPLRPARPGRRAGTGSSPDRPPLEEDDDVPPSLFQPPTLQRMGRWQNRHSKEFVIWWV